MGPESRGASLSRAADLGGILSPGLPPLALWLRCPAPDGSSSLVGLSAGLVRRTTIGRLRVESRYVIANRCPIRLRCRPIALSANRLPLLVRDVTNSSADLDLPSDEQRPRDLLAWAEVAPVAEKAAPGRLLLLLAAPGGGWSLPVDLQLAPNRTDLRRCVGLRFEAEDGEAEAVELRAPFSPIAGHEFFRFLCFSVISSNLAFCLQFCT